MEVNAVAERKSAEKGTRKPAKGAAGDQAVLAKIAEMPKPDRTMAERLHAIITAGEPDLSPKT